MKFFVSQHVILARESTAANAALKRTFRERVLDLQHRFLVYLFVTGQVRSFRERGSASHARIRAPSRVSHVVGDQVRPGAELPVTDKTLVGFLPGVNANVLLELIGGTETALALLTFERPVGDVRPLVVLQVTELCELLFADAAFVRFLASVSSLMHDQRVAFVEALLTVRTLVFLQPAVFLTVSDHGALAAEPYTTLWTLECLILRVCPIVSDVVAGMRELFAASLALVRFDSAVSSAV